MDARKCLNGGQFDIAKLEPLCSAVTIAMSSHITFGNVGWNFKIILR